MIEIQLELPIRPYDVDVAGIVSNIVYVRWLEDLRMELLRGHFPMKDLMARNLMPVLVRTEIDYRRSLRFHDGCTGRMQLAEIGRTSNTLRATFHNRAGELAAEATQIGVFVNSQTGRPVPLPDEIRAAFDGGRVNDER